MSTRDGTLRVMLVEDHALVRSALASALAEARLDIVAEAATGEEALAMARALRPDIVLLDLELPGMSGLELLTHLAQELSDTRFIVLSAWSDPRDVVDAFRRGAVGFLTKDLSTDALRRAIMGAARGELALSRLTGSQVVGELLNLVQRPGKTDPVSRLSERERDVLRLLADGLSDREIAAALGLSPRTAESHVSNILRKLAVPNRAEAARQYRQRPAAGSAT